jgi:hypothetical protein
VIPNSSDGMIWVSVWLRQYVRLACVLTVAHAMGVSVV